MSVSNGLTPVRISPAFAAMETTFQLSCHALIGLSAGVPPWPLHRVTNIWPFDSRTRFALKNDLWHTLLDTWCSVKGFLLVSIHLILRNLPLSIFLQLTVYFYLNGFKCGNLRLKLRHTKQIMWDLPDAHTLEYNLWSVLLLIKMYLCKMLWSKTENENWSQYKQTCQRSHWAVFCSFCG